MNRSNPVGRAYRRFPRRTVLAALCIILLAHVASSRAAAPAEPQPTSQPAALGARLREAVLGKTYPVFDLDRARSAMEPAARWRPFAVDLAPAQWLWLPSQRTLPNTFVLFRKEIELAAVPTRAIAWLTADSRYRLTINGQRVAWGPAPCDPRQ
ncbi:MAG: hypothetical protein ACYC35_24645, partial [Pirellulales bacterium]